VYCSLNMIGLHDTMSQRLPAVNHFTNVSLILAAAIANLVSQAEETRSKIEKA
jgi:hypothetical protein